jgi:hypothetical protein
MGSRLATTGAEPTSPPRCGPGRMPRQASPRVPAWCCAWSSAPRDPARRRRPSSPQPGPRQGRRVTPCGWWQGRSARSVVSRAPVAERAVGMVHFAYAQDPGVAGDGRDRAGLAGTAGDAMAQRGARATSSSAPVVRAVRRRRCRVRQRGRRRYGGREAPAATRRGPRSVGCDRMTCATRVPAGRCGVRGRARCPAGGYPRSCAPPGPPATGPPGSPTCATWRRAPCRSTAWVCPSPAAAAGTARSPPRTRSAGRSRTCSTAAVEILLDLHNRAGERARSPPAGAPPAWSRRRLDGHGAARRGRQRGIRRAAGQGVPGRPDPAGRCP